MNSIQPQRPTEVIRYLLPRWTPIALLLVSTGAIFPLASIASAQRQGAADDRDVEIETYTELWERGRYSEALTDLEAMIATLTGRGNSARYADLADLLFAVGRVDEAIAIMEVVANEQYEPRHYLDLAMLYKYRGRIDDYENALNRVLATSRGSWRNRIRDRNYIAIWRVYEIRGENPRTLLSTSYQSLFEKRPNFYHAYIGAGDLAYRKYAYDIAAGHYRKALEIKANNQNALAGLAECYWKSNDPRLQETLDEILDINPNNPRAKAIVIERLLDMGKAQEALDVANEILAINPNQIRALSLKAAAYFLLDDLKTMGAIQKQILHFNPYATQAFRTPGRIASRRYRFSEAADFQRRALTVDPIDHEARALHGMDLLRLGQEKKGRKELEKAFDEDSYNVQVFNMLEVLDHTASFDRIERGPFILQLPPDERLIMEEDVFDLLFTAYDLYTEKYNVTLDIPVHIQIFDSHDDFMVRSIGLPGSTGYLGICFGRLLTMDSPSARPKWAVNWRSVLLHEFVHIITLQKTKNRMPRWLSEGISVYEETRHADAWGQHMDINYKPIVDDEGLPGLSDLEQYFAQPQTPNHLMFGYFLAGEFVDFYVNAYGFEPLTASLQLIAEGTKAREALAKTADRTVADVDKDFNQFLTKRLDPYNNIPRIREPKDVEPNFVQFLASGPPKPEPWKKMNSPFTNALRQADNAADDEKWDETEKWLHKAYDLFPDYAAPDAPLRRLIRLYSRLDEQDKLEDALRKQINFNATDVPSCRRLISLLVEKGEWIAAGEIAQWALGVDPFDIDMRKLVLKAQLEELDADAALRTLSQLADLDAPHAAEYGLTRVKLLADGGKLDRAKTEVVSVLEQTPYYWEAQDLLLQIIDKKTQGKAFAVNP